jgi:predicted permease
MVQDIRYALRTFRRAPGVAATVVLVLGAVIGLNTTLFTVLAGIAWRPWPGVQRPDEVVRLYLADQNGPVTGLSIANAGALGSATSLAGAAVMKNENVRIGEGDAIAPRSALMVSGRFFDLLGVRFAAGRGFAEAEDRIGAPAAVTIITYAFWQSQFGGDAGAVGSTIQINGAPFTVVGITDAAFGTAEPVYDKSLFLPISALTLLHPGDPSYLRFLTGPDECCSDVVARVRSGVSVTAARAELNVLARNFTTISGGAPSSIVVAGTEFLSQPGRGDSSGPLAVAALLVTALLLIWLIACANVGNLLLSRAAARVGEIGTRLAIGASRGRIVRQLLVEGFVLALAASAVGIAIAAQLPFVLFQIVAATGTVGYFPFSVTPDATVLAYAVILAALSSMAFGLAPALFVTRADVVAWLNCQDAFPAMKFPLRSVLLAVQTALSIILLVSAGLLIRGVQRQAGTFDPGFTVEGVTAVSFTLPEGVYDRGRATALFDQIGQEVLALPIDAAAFAGYDPFSRFRGGTMFHLPGESPQQSRPIFYVNVSTQYFQLLGLPLRAGRYFDEADLAGGAVIINESMARRVWPGEDPIGRSLFMRMRGPSGTMAAREIVGVVADVRTTTSDGTRPILYQPYRPGADVFGFISGDPRASQAPVLLIKAGSDVTEAVTRMVRRIDPRILVQGAPLSDSVEAVLRESRWGPILASALGMFALVLTTVGVAGVFGYAVRQRRREIGIRMALGAPAAAVIRSVLTRHARALAAGSIAGLAGAVLSSMLLRNRLHGLSPLDPVAYLAVAGLLVVCAIAAGYWPARRIVRINPLEALRQL